MADDRLSNAFEAQRARLIRVAYGTLGSVAEAEDVVQDAWVKLERMADPSEIRDLRSFLTTMVGRLALDELGSARRRREHYVGSWLPEPLVSDLDPDANPADRVTFDETVSMALMVVLDELGPAERTSFVLHDVFGVPFDEIAEAVGRTPDAVRQLASRARRRVREGRPRHAASPGEHLHAVTAFAAACTSGNFDDLLEMLDPDVVSSCELVWSPSSDRHYARPREPSRRRLSSPNEDRRAHYLLLGLPGRSRGRVGSSARRARRAGRR